MFTTYHESNILITGTLPLPSVTTEIKVKWHVYGGDTGQVTFIWILASMAVEMPDHKLLQNITADMQVK